MSFDRRAVWIYMVSATILLAFGPAQFSILGALATSMLLGFSGLMIYNLLASPFRAYPYAAAPPPVVVVDSTPPTPWWWDFGQYNRRQGYYHMQRDPQHINRTFTPAADHNNVNVQHVNRTFTPAASQPVMPPANNIQHVNRTFTPAGSPSVMPVNNIQHVGRVFKPK